MHVLVYKQQCTLSSQQHHNDIMVFISHVLHDSIMSKVGIETQKLLFNKIDINYTDKYRGVVHTCSSILLFIH